MVRPPLSPQMLTVLLLGRFSAQEILKVTVMPFFNIKLFHVELSGSEQTGGSSALRIGELNILLLVDDPGHSTSTDGNHLRVTGN